MARILIACEESQATTKEFRKLGHEAFSCDLLHCSGGHPGWHYQCDIFEVINKGWDLMVAHPPCTFLTGSGVQWLSHPEDKALPFEERRPHPKYPNRRNDMLDSVEFVKALYNAPIEHIAIENPVGLLSSRWRKPDQIVQPYMFGDEATKTTCLWLKNLPLLQPTRCIEPRIINGKKRWGNQTDSGQNRLAPSEERGMLRSKTFPGIAKALATQYSSFISSGLSVNEWNKTPLR